MDCDIGRRVVANKSGVDRALYYVGDNDSRCVSTFLCAI